MRVTVINNYLTPYRDELFSEILAHEGSRDFEIIYAAQPEAKRRAVGWGNPASDREDRIRFANEPVLHMPFSENRIVVPFRIVHWLFFRRRDLLICTLSRDMVLVQLVCFLATRFSSARLVYWIGDVDAGERPGFLHRVIDLLRLVVARRADGQIFYSAKSKEWLQARSRGRSQEAYWIGGQVRANHQSDKQWPPESSGRKAVLRLLTVGGDDPRKGLDQLLGDLSTLPPSLGVRLEVIVVGGKHRYRRRVAGIRVLSAGRLPHEEMPHIYSRADIAIIASSREPWGFVFNEAVQAGRPCIVSDRAGSATVASSFGLTYTPGNPASLTSAIQKAKELSAAELKSISSLLSVKTAAQSFSKFATSIIRGQSCAFRDY